MATDAFPGHLTYDDYAALPYDGKRYQLIDGELVLTPAGTISHQRLVGRLHLAIGNYLREHTGGEVLVAPVDVVLDRYQVLQPDVLVVLADRLDRFTRSNLQGSPDLAIEVLSPSTSRWDLGRKRQLYQEYGVREYWVCHQDSPRIEVYRFEAAESVPRLLGAEHLLETSLLPGFSLSVDDLYQGILD